MNHLGDAADGPLECSIDYRMVGRDALCQGTMGYCLAGIPHGPSWTLWISPIRNTPNNVRRAGIFAECGGGLRRAPVREAIGGRDVGQPGIGVSDICPKELPKPLLSLARLCKELWGESGRNPGRNRRAARPSFRDLHRHPRLPAICYS